MDPKRTKSTKKDAKVTPIKLQFQKDKINNYNENYEYTMNNVYTVAIMMHQVYSRLGYQIKKQEETLDIQKQILAELKKGKK